MIRRIGYLVLVLGFIVSMVGNQVSQAESKEGSLVAYYKFDEGEGEFLEDSSGYLNHGTVHGNPIWGEGISGSCFYFDGVDDYVSFASSPTSLDDITKEVTVEVWMNRESGGIAAGKPYWSITGNGARIYVKTFHEGEYHSGSYNASADISSGVWHHAVMTYDSDILKFYLDGELKATNAKPEGAIPILTGEFFLGCYCGPGRGEFFKGAIDEARVYNRVLSEEEIKAHYASKGIKTKDLTPVHEKVLFSDDFSNLSTWILSGHRNGKVLSKIKGQYTEKSDDIRYEKHPTLKLHYDFNTQGEDACLITKECNVEANKDSLLKVTIYGDKSYTTLFLVLKDKTGESHFLNIGKVFWEGWKTIPIRLSLLSIPPAKGAVDGRHFGGDENQVLNYPIKAITLGVSDKGDAINASGYIYLADVKILKVKR